MKSLPLTRINLISSLTLLLALWLGSGWLAPAAYAGDDYFVNCGPAAQRLSQLKEGIEAANANTGLDTLILSPNCLYNFVAPLDLANESALPEITDDLLIRGQGATIQRDADTDRRFRLITIGSQAEVTIEDLALRHGLKPLDPGGGIYAGAGTSLTLKGVILQDNHSNGGGGVAALGPVTVIDSHFLDNRGSRKGGGLYGEAEVSVTGSRFENNSAGSGGGLYSLAEVRLTGGRFEGNRALSGDGGGLFIQGSVTLTGTKVVSNTAEEAGGGLSINGEFEAIEARITGGYVAHNRALTGNSGGVHMAFGTLILTDTTILNNRAGDLGGGIGTADGANVMITGGQVTGNTGKTGGGLEVDGTLNLNGTIVLSNTAQDLGGGVLAGTALVENGRFENNQATHGGGVFALRALVENSRFENNQVLSGHGGGLFVRDLTLKQTTLISNNVRNVGGAGGGVISQRVTLEGNTFIRNGGDGAGLFLFDPSDAVSEIINNLWVDNIPGPTEGSPSIIAFLNNDSQELGHVRILHNTVTGSIPVNGSAFFIQGFSATLQNNIITHHKTGIQLANTRVVTADHNLYFGNTANEFGAITSSDNLEADPLFIDPANGDFHLLPNSPARDSGLDAGVTIDLDGAPRPTGPGFDIGAFEFGAPPPDPTPEPAPNSGGNVSMYLPIIMK